MSRITAILNHRVANYNAWRKLFDEGAAHRAQYGINVKDILVSDNDPNDVTVICDGHSNDFDRFLQDPELHNFMQRAGVVSEPVMKKFVGGE